MEEIQPMPPPRESDVLFRPDQEHCMSNACIGYSRSGVPYSEGYRIAARSLADQTCTTHRDQDLLVYPIVFLYRHHVELVLKRLTIVGAFLLDQNLDGNQALQHHGLKPLWNAFKPILKKVAAEADQPPLPDEDIRGIDAYINQLSKVDPSGQAFRYFQKKDSSQSLPDDLRHINIAIFRNHIEQLCSYLDGIDEFFAVLQDGKNEMLAEHAANGEW